MKLQRRTTPTAAVLCIAAVALFLAAGCAPCTPPKPGQLLPNELQWHSSPSLHSLQTAMLAGDPAAPAPYAQRIKLPPHHRLEPHFHPNQARMVTVLSGTFYFAYGDTFDETKLRLMPPGSFFTEPANMPHFARTGDDEVILQLNAIGPDGTTYVTPPKH